MLDTLNPVIQSIKALSIEQRAALFQHLEAIRQEDEVNEKSIVNQCLSAPCQACPHCKSTWFIRHGKYKNRHRYLCKVCDRTFNDFTGTVLHYIHDHEKFEHYFKCMAQQKSLRQCEREVGICLHTSFYWRHKILKAFETADLKPLKKLIQADDTYLGESFKGNTDVLKQAGRSPRKRGGGIKAKAMLKEYACILAACDEAGHTLLTHVGMGRLTKSMVINALAPFIRKQRVHRAVFVTDRHSAYYSLVQQKNLNHQTVCASIGQKVNPLGFHIQAVNALHSRFKRWIARFNGVSTKYLQNYLNYFRLWDKFTYVKERLIYFLKCATQDVNVFVKITDIFLE